MSSAGRVASSSGCVARPRGRETGLTGYAEQIQHSSPTGSSVMETAEHREPYESRGSRTDLGAPGGESPPGDSTTGVFRRWKSPSDQARARTRAGDVGGKVAISIRELPIWCSCVDGSGA